ncbi:hypothetical protein [Oxynema sp. CENA135]|uniref:hypothetical protein n=1 Tax=Oxynema sp. CENA135 TaxID=984206 RepID=UPI001F1DD967|nr:hypothetical protein [Oxynema sp. CENA135]
MLLHLPREREVYPMNVFTPTHKLRAPAGEEIPVMLVSQPGQLRYLVVSAVEHAEGSVPTYTWHPSEGVTYQGYPLEGLEMLPLSGRQEHELSPRFPSGEASRSHRQEIGCDRYQEPILWAL